MHEETLCCALPLDTTRGIATTAYHPSEAGKVDINQINEDVLSLIDRNDGSVWVTLVYLVGKGTRRLSWRDTLPAFPSIICIERYEDNLTVGSPADDPGRLHSHDQQPFQIE